MQPIQQRYGLGSGFSSVLLEETAADNDHQPSVVPGGDRQLLPFSIPKHPKDRQLAIFTLGLTFSGFNVNIGDSISVDVTISFSKPDPRGSIFTIVFNVDSSVSVDVDGTGTADVGVDEAFLNDDKTGICDTCSIDAEANECTAGDCGGYSRDGTNGNLVAQVSVE